MAVPDSSTTSPAGKSTKPATIPTPMTVTALTSAYAATPANFTPRSRVRPAGTTRTLRNVPVLASPATDSPATTEMASGRNSGMATTTEARPRKSPFCVTCVMNGGPSPAVGAAARIAMPSRIGPLASTASIARLRRRRNTRPSSDRRNRMLTSRAGADETAENGPPVSSLVDIEAFPRQLHEHLLEVGLLEDELAHRDPGSDQRLYQPLAGHVAQFGDDAVRPDVGLTGAQLVQNGGRGGRPFRVDPDPYGRGLPELTERSGEDQPSVAHHAHMAAHLLDLRK